jgi:hypothetical protein
MKVLVHRGRARHGWTAILMATGTATPSRGKLRVYLGAAPGAGKTPEAVFYQVKRIVMSCLAP